MLADYGKVLCGFKLWAPGSWAHIPVVGLGISFGFGGQ